MSNIIIICLLVTNIIGFGAVIYLLCMLNDAHRAMLIWRSKLVEPFFERLRNISNDEDAIYAHTRDITELMYDIRDILKVTLNQKRRSKMKVKHVLKDLGPKTLVQIYKPSSVSDGYVERFLKAYPAGEINYLDYSWVKSDLEKEVDHVEYGHYYATDEMVASCNIYLKTEQAASREKQDTATIDYADLKKKWNQFCKEYCVESADIIHAWHINVFLNTLENGELNEMEDKDLS